MDGRLKFRIIVLLIALPAFMFVCLVEKIEVNWAKCSSTGTRMLIPEVQPNSNAKTVYSADANQHNINISSHKIIETPNVSDSPVYLIYDFDHGRGLGNCLFRLASIYGIARAGGHTPVFRYHSKILDYFDVSWPRPSNFDDVIFDEMKTQFGGGAEFSHKYFIEARETKDSLNLKGYYQSWKYFQNYSADVRAMLTFKKHIADAARRYLDELRQRHAAHTDTSPLLIGVHVRRGDIADASAGFNKVGYTTPTAKYYTKAMTYFKDIFAGKSLIFVVCTNDANWTREHLSSISGLHIAITQNDQGLDLAILSQCDHVIMSVGTFSWWAAWLANGVTIYYDLWPTPGSWLDRKTKREDYFMPYWIPLH